MESLLSPNKMQWYKVFGYIGHVGAKKEHGIVFYIKASDAVDALDKYSCVPYTKKLNPDRGFRNSHRVPDISEIGEDEQKKLEEIIADDQYCRDKANIWYYLPDSGNSK